MTQYFDIPQDKLDRAIRVAEGLGKWDMMFVPYPDREDAGEFLCVAKEEGCCTSIYGDRHYVTQSIMSGYGDYMITLQGQEILGLNDHQMKIAAEALDAKQARAKAHLVTA